jgi:hypothetical protein
MAAFHVSCHAIVMETIAKHLTATTRYVDIWFVVKIVRWVHELFDNIISIGDAVWRNEQFLFVGEVVELGVVLHGESALYVGTEFGKVVSMPHPNVLFAVRIGHDPGPFSFIQLIQALQR